MLNNAIDRLNRVGGPAEPVNVLASTLDPGSLREAVLIHLSALLEAEPTRLTEDRVTVAGLDVRVVESDDPSAPIRYEDVGLGFDLDGVRVERRDGPASLASLLTIFHYARDGSDTLLYLPAEMRSERIREVAARTGASERFLRYVIARFSSLAAKVAA